MKRLILTVVLLVLSLLLITSNACKRNSANSVVSTKITNKVFPLRLMKEKEVKIDAIVKGTATLRKTESREDVFMKFVSDTDTNVWRYNFNIDLEKRFLIPYGQGPGECLNNFIIGGNKENILVYDSITAKYYFFDETFSVSHTLNSRRYETFVLFGNGFSTSKNMIVTSFQTLEGPDSIRFDILTRKISGDGITDNEIYKIENFKVRSKDGYMVALPFHFKMIDDYIYILRTDEYRIIKMDLDGKVVKEIKVSNPGKKMFSKEERKRWIKESAIKRPWLFIFPGELWSACWLMELGDGIAVGRRENYQPGPRDWLDADYFDKDLNYLGKIKVPGFPKWNNPYDGQVMVDILFAFQGDKLFFIETRENEEGEEFWLTRWRIEDGTGRK